MQIKYAVYDATTGDNKMFETKEEAIKMFWKNVVKLALNNFHNTAYTVVEILDDGTERWYNDNNEEIELPKTEAEILEFLQEYRRSGLDNQSQTSVEILP